MSALHIRAATPADTDRIAAWQVAMAAETEDRVLPLERVRSGIESVFADPTKGRYVVAEDTVRGVVGEDTVRGGALGSLLVTREWSDWRDGWFWWIQSVYIEPDARGRGLYRRMYEHVLGEARADGDVCGVRLYVEVENTHALAVYRHLGMDETSYRLLEVDFSD